MMTLDGPLVDCHHPNRPVRQLVQLFLREAVQLVAVVDGDGVDEVHGRQTRFDVSVMMCKVWLAVRSSSAIPLCR